MKKDIKISIRKAGKWQVPAAKKVTMNKAIEERSVKIQEKTDMFFANEIVAQKVKEQKIRERQKGGWER